MVASCCLLVALAPLPGCAASFPEPANPGQQVPSPVPPIIDAAEAALFIGHEGVTFVDARGHKPWKKGHVPGAVHLDWTELRDPGAGLMTGKLGSDIDHLATVLGERGVSNDDWVIVVGDPTAQWGEDGRIAWTLRYLGHRDISIVDGGWPAWAAEDLPVQKGRMVLPATTYVGVPNEAFLARKKDVRRYSDNSGDWRYVIVDVRSSGEFRGAPGSPKYGAARRGHVPGATNLPWQVLLDADGKVRSADELEDVLIPLGIRPDAHVITYCTGGVRSAHTFWILHSLGYPSVRNYAGSWWEWSLDRKQPGELGGLRAPPPAPPWPPEPLLDDDDSGAADDDDSGARPAP